MNIEQSKPLIFTLNDLINHQDRNYKKLDGLSFREAYDIVRFIFDLDNVIVIEDMREFIDNDNSDFIYNIMNNKVIAQVDEQCIDIRSKRFKIYWSKQMDGRFTFHRYE